MNRADIALAYLRSFEAHRDTRWFVAPCANPLDIADSEMEPWYHYVLERMKEAVGVTGHQSSQSDFDMPDLKAILVTTVAGGPLRTKLSLVRLSNGLFVFVSGEGDVSEAEIGIWSEAIATAFQRLGQAHPEHDWWAVLGPDSRRRGMMRPFVGAIDLDRLSLRTADFGYRETIPVSLGGMWHTHHWVPVIVKGRSVGYDWHAASHAAHRDLYALAALLSLKSGDYWTLRQRPTSIEWGNPVLFESVGPPGQLGPLQRLSSDEEAQRRGEAAPVDCERLSHAWRQLRRESRLLRPVSAYYRGVSLIDDHPSFAVVAFVTAIEEVGTLLVQQESPAICSVCGQRKFNPSRRLFRKTLELSELKGARRS
jgi:hypothetical protein